MGSAVGPLKVKFPDTNQNSLATPMKFEPSEVTFLICPPVSLTSLCFPSRDTNLECFAVSEKTFKTLVNDRSRVRKSIWLERK